MEKIMGLFETKHEKKSASITTVVSIILLLLLFFFGFTYLDPPPENGIAVNFGTTDVGSGDQQPTEPVASSPQKNTSTPTPQEETTAETVEEEVITQESEEAPVIEDNEEEKVTEEVEETQEEETQEPVEEEKPEEKEEEEPEPEPEPQPEKSTSDALNSVLNGPEQEGEAEAGEGDDNQAGDKGDPDGDPDATSYYGQGTGLDGDGNYRLGGRKALNKEKFVQDCNESGVVVVKIEVDQQGNVISATPGVKGTTNTSSCLLEPAKRAALATKFNSDAEAPAKQVGTIVYEFKLSE